MKVVNISRFYIFIFDNISVNYHISNESGEAFYIILIQILHLYHQRYFFYRKTNIIKHIFILFIHSLIKVSPKGNIFKANTIPKNNSELTNQLSFFS